MTLQSIKPPYDIFFDLDGSPIEDGYIYIGEANTNPITNPINVYWDIDRIYPAAQPIRTISGYPSWNGSAANIYIPTTYNDFSILVKNKTLETVFYVKTNANQNIAQALSIYSAGGALYYKDSGAVNAYVLTIVSPNVSPSAYFDGFCCFFEPGTTNTGASTVNVAGLGVKSLTYQNGNPLAGGELTGTCLIKYNLSDDRFEFIINSDEVEESSFAYIVDSTQADQGAASTNSDTLTIFDIAALVGTSKHATVKLLHNPVAGNQTLYTFDTSLDLSAYPLLCFDIDPGAQIDRTTGDEIFTLYSSTNLIITKSQKITSVDMLSFANGGNVFANWWGALSATTVGYAIGSGATILTINSNTTLTSNWDLSSFDGKLILLAQLDGAFTLTVPNDFEGIQNCFASNIDVANLKWVNASYWGMSQSLTDSQNSAILSNLLENSDQYAVVYVPPGASYDFSLLTSSSVTRLHNHNIGLIDYSQTIQNGAPRLAISPHLMVFGDLDMCNPGGNGAELTWCMEEGDPTELCIAVWEYDSHDLTFRVNVDKVGLVQIVTGALTTVNRAVGNTISFTSVLSPGDTVRISGATYTVNTVTGVDEFTITSSYTGTLNTDVDCVKIGLNQVLQLHGGDIPTGEISNTLYISGENDQGTTGIPNLIMKTWDSVNGYLEKFKIEVNSSGITRFYTRNTADDGWVAAFYVNPGDTPTINLQSAEFEGNLNFDSVSRKINIGGSTLNSYAGNPEGNLSASPGSICMNATNPIGSGEYAVYIKRIGGGNTGWEGIGTVIP